MIPSSSPEAESIGPQTPRVSVVIVSFNRAAALRNCIELLEGMHQVVVVDNGSTDGSAGIGDDFPAVRLMRLPKNFGLTKALNIGLRAAEGEYILCLHDDARISGESVTRMADFLEARADVGAVCPLLTDESGDPVPQVRELPGPAAPDPPLRPATGGEEIEAACVSGAAFMFRAFFLRALRQIDERYGTYGSEIELCAQMRRAGKKIAILRGVPGIHEFSASAAPENALQGDRVTGTAVFLAKHHGFLASLLYRLKSGLIALLTFRFNVVAAAFGGQKIDGTG